MFRSEGRLFSALLSWCGAMGASGGCQEQAEAWRVVEVEVRALLPRCKAYHPRQEIQRDCFSFFF